MRTAPQALAYSRQFTTYSVGYCARFVQNCYGGPWIGTSAKDAWYRTRGKRYSWAPPAGVPVYWIGGTYWHVAMSTGNGNCRSTDWPYRGRVSEVGIGYLASRWGYRYLGWGADINGSWIQGIYSAPATTVVYSSVLRYGLRNESIRLVQRRLIALGFSIPAGATGYWGDQTVRAVAAWQRSKNQPYPYNTGRSMGPKQATLLMSGTGTRVV
jgi:hypothetical protein